MELNKNLKELLTKVALRKSELEAVDGLYSVRIKNEYGYFIVYIGTRKTLHYVAVPDVLALEKSLILMLYRIGRLNQRVIEDVKKIKLNEKEAGRFSLASFITLSKTIKYQ